MIQAALSDNSMRQLEITQRLDKQFSVVQGDQRTFAQLILETQQQQLEQAHQPRHS